MLKKLVNCISGLLASRTAATGSAGSHAGSGAAPGLPEDDLRMEEACRNFPRELFARLLIELPSHRQIMSDAYAGGNDRQLRDCVHQLLGATAYCDAPELETGLRELQLALKTANRETIDFYYDRAINVVDSTLRYSGYREG
jgi:two-component system sensor histidine kinase BarA